MCTHRKAKCLRFHLSFRGASQRVCDERRPVLPLLVSRAATAGAGSPLGDLPKRVHELDSSREIVAHCRSGARSAKAVDFLRQAGFKKVHNLAGGILAWAERVDPKMPKY